MGTITRTLANNITTGGVILPSGINNSSISNVTALPAGVGGKVLQVVQGSSTTEFTEASPSNNTTYYPSSNKLTVTITPTSTSSKIIVNAISTVRVQKDAQTGDLGIALVIKEIISGGSTTELYPSSLAYRSGMYTGANAASQNIRFRHNEIVYRSPATTSSITYEVGMFSYASLLDQIWLNDGGGRAEITAYEVQG